MSNTDNVPLTVPLAVGVNDTEMVQLAPAAIEPEQVLVCEKGDAVLTAVRARVPVPVLVKVTVCGGLVVPFSCVEKVRLVGERLTAGLPANALPPIRGIKHKTRQTSISLAIVGLTISGRGFVDD